MTPDISNKDTTKKERAWLLPDSDKGRIDPGLYLIATPIGNLRDISIRALDTLAAVDVVFCEDTRVTKKLLSHYGLSKKAYSYNDHNADKQRASILKQIKDGQAIALVSDAGTPLVSDPGFKLARDALDEGVFVTTVPGASAPVSALQLSGLPSDKFSFIGFLPVKKGAREKVLDEWRGISGTLVAFESARRLLTSLASIRAVYGDRQMAVVREITKLFEESRRGSVSELIAFYEQNGLPKGEIVLVIAQGNVSHSSEDVRALLQSALKKMSTKDAAADVAAQTGMAKKDLYSMALDIAKNSDV